MKGIEKNKFFTSNEENTTLRDLVKWSIISKTMENNNMHNSVSTILYDLYDLMFALHYIS